MTNIFVISVEYILQIIMYLVGATVFFPCKIKIKLAPIVAGGTAVVVLAAVTREGRAYDGAAILVYLLAVLINAFLIVGTIGQKIFISVSLFCICTGMTEIFGIFLCHGMEFFETNKRIASIVEICCTTLVCLCFYTVKSKFQLNYEKMVEYLKKFIIYIIIFTIMCEMFVVCMLVYAKKYVLNTKIRTMYDWLAIVAIVGMTGIVLFVIYIRMANDKISESLKMEYELQNMQAEHYHILLDKESDTRKYRHDMMNHLLCLSELAETGKKEELEDYLAELRNDFSKIQKKAYLTGNDIIDIVLNHYLTGLEGVFVSVSGQCGGTLSVTNMELCTIISNILKNAAEEVERITGRDKYINVKLIQRNQYLVIIVKNTSLLVKNKEDNQLTTSKKDRKNHGIGLKNIMETVEKNHGRFTLSGDGKEAVAEVILPCNFDR